MKRAVLAVPLEEVKQHLASNVRQDIKIVVPELLDELLYKQLQEKRKPVKQEKPLQGHRWKHSKPSKPNPLCESSDFVEGSEPSSAHSSFALSFANEKAGQDEHYHREHVEIYYSEQRLSAKYRCLDEMEHHTVILKHGGALVFAPGVVHQVKLTGLTLVIEVPSVKDDKAEEHVRKTPVRGNHRTTHASTGRSASPPAR